MKKGFLLIALSIIYITGVAQAGANNICRLGFTFEISKNLNWGFGFPVVTEVTPYSPAELEGIKHQDIIEEIDGIDIRDFSYEDVERLLNPVNKNVITLKTSNLIESERIVRVVKDCKKTNAITEAQLAQAFAMMSLESTSERVFICPFRTSVTSNPISFSLFRTFGFAQMDDENSSIENDINNSIRDELRKKGLVYEEGAPDLLIRTYYVFDKNPNYRGTNRVVIDKEINYRYNINRNRMEQVPFLSHSAAESEAEYIIQFGIKIIDNIYQPGRILWECEANELMDDTFLLSDYARMHIPLMFMQYPYVKYARNVQYRVSTNTYNYTGISYDINNLERVAYVDPNSPAAAAGIQTSDIIDRIEKGRLDMSVEELSTNYKTFITRTMKLRDPKTRFTDANGFTRCMFWDTFKYPQVVDAIKKTEGLAAFSYLFYFAPYVNSSGTNACDFTLRRGRNKTTVMIRPTIRTELSVTID